MKMKKFLFLIVLLLMFSFGISYAEQIYEGNVSVGSCPTGVASHKIVYNSNGGSELEADCVSSRIESDTSLPTPTKDGYIFGGWYYDSGLTKEVDVDSYRNIPYIKEYDEKGCTKMVTTTLYAKWLTEIHTEISGKCPAGVASRIISFESNGGSSIEPIAISSMILKDYSIPKPSRSGYTFEGWYYDANFNYKVNATDIRDVDYAASLDQNNCTITDRVTLYAKWSKQIGSGSVCPSGVSSHKIVYNSNGGSKVDPDYVSSKISSDTSLPIPVKAGYKFDGWYYDSKLTKKVNVNSYRDIPYTKKYDENGCTKLVTTTLYAKWNKLTVEEENEEVKCEELDVLYTIIYNTNDGNIISDYNHCVDCDTKDELIPTPVREGYVFDGWYYDSEFTQKVESTYANKIVYEQVQDSNGCLVVSTINLYAKWTIENSTNEITPNKVEVNVIFDTNGGINIGPKNVCISCEGENKLLVPKKEGYEFLGWYYDKFFIKKVDVTYLEELENTYKNGDNSISLYAKWRKIETEDKISIVPILVILIVVLLIISAVVILIKRKKQLN